MKSLNAKESKRKGTQPKVLYGKCPQHFVDRIFARVERTQINTIVSKFLHYIHDNKGVLVSECVATVTTTHSIPIDKYIVYVELSLNTANVLAPMVIVTPKTIIEKGTQL